MGGARNLLILREHSGLVSAAMCAVVLLVASPNEDDIRQETVLLTKVAKIGIIKGLKVTLAHFFNPNLFEKNAGH